MEKEPEIAKYFNEETETKIEVPQVDETAPIYDHWEKCANRLMTSLAKQPKAWIFSEPVDPTKLGIHDYFDIIKHPMDFSTIKQKLKDHQYNSMTEFCSDIELTFNNCIIYNGEAS